MDSDVLTTLISGLVSIVCAFGSILLKDHLDRRRAAEAAVGPASQRASPGIGSLLLALLLAGAAMAFGYFGYGFLRQQIAGVYLFYWLDLLISVPLVAYFVRARSRSLVGYLLSLAALWAGLFAGLNAQRGGASDDGVAVVVFSWIGSAVFGFIVFAVVRPAARARA